jgi:hypothetical protein
MRNSKLKALELEQAEHEQRQSRNNGLSLMEVRDRGWYKLDNGSVIEWGVDRPLYNGEVRRHVPEGYFFLNGKIYDVDEFRKFLRWA